MHRKVHVRFGPGATGKGPAFGGHLASGLPVLKIGDVFSIALSRRGDAVLIEVRDSSEASPDCRARSVDRVDGRGLLLVAACSKDWGWRLEEQGGKTVWAVVGGCEEFATTVRPADDIGA